MKPLCRVVFILGIFLILTGASTKSRLIGKWDREYGEEIRTVTLYEFKEDGTFYREITLSLPPPGGKLSNERVNGKWSLTTEKTGIRALFEDPNRLTLAYEKTAKTLSEQPVSGLTPTRIYEVYIVIISKEDRQGGKETLQLSPPDGEFMGTTFFSRVDSPPQKR
jgi:hypothetical protein